MNCPICHSLNNEQVYKKLSQSITSDSELVNFPISNVICFDCGNVFNETGARNQVNKFYADDYKLHEETKKQNSNILMMENLLHIRILGWKYLKIFSLLQIREKF